MCEQFCACPESLYFQLVSLSMDLISTSLKFSHDIRFAQSEQAGDTTLSLNCFSNKGNSAARCGGSQVNRRDDLFSFPDDGCRLVLGLGPTPTAYCDDHSTGFKHSKGSAGSDKFPKESSSEADSILKLSSFGGTKGAFGTSTASFTQFSDPDSRVLIPVVDEGSTSAKKSGGYMPSLLLAPRVGGCNVLLHPEKNLELRTNSDGHHPLQLIHEPSSTTDFSTGTISEQATTATSDRRSSNSKKCSFFGCSKGARGASGFCIGHGGGQRCQKPGCNKGSESRTAYCKAHGGGRRCQHLGCTKSAEGKTDFCIAHGGGRRCGYGGCNKAARGKSGLCIRHGGGKRCRVEGCTRSAEGQAGLCISHGGGRRCQYQECMKGAQGSTKFCKAHGGGKRCIFAGCLKGAEGSTPLCKGHGGGKRCLYDGGGICPKSVHGGTNFCVAHGGGKRCVVAGCTKSARGRTDCCVKHGGGKRCKHEDCGKSAQGSTNFCKAHGGGKRCTWEEGKCEKFARGKSGLCAAHSSLVQERVSNKVGLLGPGLFHGLVSVASSTGPTINNNRSSCGASTVYDCVESLQRPTKKQNLIPPQVLVPLSMKSSASFASFSSAEKPEVGNGRRPGVAPSTGLKSSDFMVPEGRVHGGKYLMSLFGGT